MVNSVETFVFYNNFYKLFDVGSWQLLDVNASHGSQQVGNHKAF